MSTKKIQFSNTSFTVYMMLFLLVGAGITGIPLLFQSKGYYDELQTKDKELLESKAQAESFTKNSIESRSALLDEYNIAVKDRNTLLRAIEKAEGDLPNWQPMKCKDGLLETPIDC